MEFGRHLGLAFQIYDDILDFTGDEKTLGKSAGKDAKANKSTYVTLFGLQRADEMGREATENAVKALRIFGGEAGSLKNLAIMLAKRKK